MHYHDYYAVLASSGADVRAWSWVVLVYVLKVKTASVVWLSDDYNMLADGARILVVRHILLLLLLLLRLKEYHQSLHSRAVRDY